MAEKRKPITTKGKFLLEKELKRLIEIERPKVISAIEVARGHGDLSENADYTAAKERQSYIEGRIANLSNTLSNAEVIDTSKIKSDKITFGAYVHLQDEDGKKITYQIVGEGEADVSKKKISIHSPLARQLIGKKKNQEFELHNPKGEKMYQVIDFYFK